LVAKIDPNQFDYGSFISKGLINFSRNVRDSILNQANKNLFGMDYSRSHLDPFSILLETNLAKKLKVDGERKKFSRLKEE